MLRRYYSQTVRMQCPSPLEFNPSVPLLAGGVRALAGNYAVETQCAAIVEARLWLDIRKGQHLLLANRVVPSSLRIRCWRVEWLHALYAVGCCAHQKIRVGRPVGWLSMIGWCAGQIASPKMGKSKQQQRVAALTKELSIYSTYTGARRFVALQCCLLELFEAFCFHILPHLCYQILWFMPT